MSVDNNSESSDYSDLQEFPIADTVDSDGEDGFRRDCQESTSSPESQLYEEKVEEMNIARTSSRKSMFSDLRKNISGKLKRGTDKEPARDSPRFRRDIPYADDDSSSDEDLDAGLDTVLGLTKDETHVEISSSSSDEEKEAMNIIGLSTSRMQRKSETNNFQLSHVQYDGIDEATNNRDLSTFDPLDKKRAKSAFDHPEIPPIISSYGTEKSVESAARSGRSSRFSTKSPVSAVTGSSRFSSSIIHSDVESLSRQDVESVVGPVPESFFSSLKGFFDLNKRTDIEIFIMALIIVSLLTLIILLALVIAKKR